MKKRLIDINSPRAAQDIPEYEEPARAAPKPRRIGMALAFLVVLLFAVPALSLHALFARATVRVWPQITKLHVQESMMAQVGYEGVDFERKIIRARIFEEEAEQTSRFPASGKKFKEEAARGFIRVYNEYSAQPQTLVANTRFVAEDGKVFRSESTAVVPGSRTDGRRVVPGVSDVEVVAAEKGEEYNINPSKFSLPGLVGTPLYTRIYGESLQAMAGGAANEVSVVTEEDIASAKNTLIEDLKAQAVKNLLAGVVPPFQVLLDSLQVQVAQEQVLVKPGAELDQFAYGATVRVAMAAFHREDADALAKRLLFSYVDSKQAVHEKTLSIEYAPSGPASEAGIIPMEIRATADQYEKLERGVFVNRIKGASVSQLSQFMQEYPFLAKTSISLWPFWMSTMPRDGNKITIELLIEG